MSQLGCDFLLQLCLQIRERFQPAGKTSPQCVKFADGAIEINFLEVHREVEQLMCLTLRTQMRR